MRIFLKISEISLLEYFCDSHVMSTCKLIMLTCDLSMSTCNIVMPKRKIKIKTCNIIEVACYLMILNVDMIMLHVNIENVIRYMTNCNRNFLGLSGCFRALPEGREKLRLRQTVHGGRLGTCILAL